MVLSIPSIQCSNSTLYLHPLSSRYEACKLKASQPNLPPKDFVADLRPRWAQHNRSGSEIRTVQRYHCPPYSTPVFAPFVLIVLSRLSMSGLFGCKLRGSNTGQSDDGHFVGAVRDASEGVISGRVVAWQWCAHSAALLPLWRVQCSWAFVQRRGLLGARWVRHCRSQPQRPNHSDHTAHALTLITIDCNVHVWECRRQSIGLDQPRHSAHRRPCRPPDSP